MGAVILAVDEEKNRLVALKCLQPQYLTDSAKVARFNREIESLKNFQSENFQSDWVVRLVDHGEFQANENLGPLMYFCMEYIEGRTLRQKLNTWGRLPQIEVARIGVELARGLEDIHRAGLFHRDLKPGNVLLDALNSEKARIVDLGLVLDPNAERISEGIVGTPRYIAPEAWLKNNGTSARSDLFSLGCILYEILTGAPAFSDDSFASTNEGPVPLRDLLPDVDGGLASVIMNLLQPDPKVRIQSAEQVRIALDAIALSIVSGARRPTDTRWPRLSSETIRGKLSAIAGPTIGIPNAWCQGPVGVVLGLGRRVQMAHDMHGAVSNVVDNLMTLDFEHLRDAPDKSSQDQFRLSLSDVHTDFQAMAERTRNEAKGLEKLAQGIAESLDTLEQLTKELTRHFSGGVLEDWESLRNCLKKGLTNMVLCKQVFVDQYIFATDRLLSLTMDIDQVKLKFSAIEAGVPGVEPVATTDARIIEHVIDENQQSGTGA